MDTAAEEWAKSAQSATHRIDVVLRGDGVRDEEPDDLHSAEGGITHASYDGLCAVGREGDKVWRRRLRVVRPPREERHLRCAVTVRHADCTSELDAEKERKGDDRYVWI